MKRILLILFLLLPLRLYAQSRSSLSGYCEQGGKTVTTAGMQSTSKVQASYPSCSVTVYTSESSGVQSGTYTSGGTATGGAGSTCRADFVGGGGYGGFATLPLSAINTLTPGTALYINVPLMSGNGYTSAPTTATLSNGSAVCTGSIVVSTTIGANKAVLYSDNSGTVLANPFTADANGYWQFWANDGVYDITLSGGGIPSPFTLFSRPNFSGQSMWANVKDSQFGAYCDNSHDDTIAIQSAINSLGYGGGIVYFPAGICRFSSTLTISNQHVKFLGATTPGNLSATHGSSFDTTNSSVLSYTGSGVGISITQVADHAGWGFEASNMGFRATKNATKLITNQSGAGGIIWGVLENCWLDGRDSNVTEPDATSTAIGIDIWEGNWRLSHVTIRGFNVGINLAQAANNFLIDGSSNIEFNNTNMIIGSTDFNSQVSLMNSTFHSARIGNIKVLKAHDLTIFGCYFEDGNLYYGGANPNLYSIELGNAVGADIDTVLIEGNYFAGQVGTNSPIHIYRARNVAVRHNRTYAYDGTANTGFINNHGTAVTGVSVGYNYLPPHDAVAYPEISSTVGLIQTADIDGVTFPGTIKDSTVLQKNQAATTSFKVRNFYSNVATESCFDAGYDDTHSIKICRNNDGNVYINATQNIANIVFQSAGATLFTITPNGNILLKQVAYASLGVPGTGGNVAYCIDCDPMAAAPGACTSAGAKTGALAVAMAGAWKCF